MPFFKMCRRVRASAWAGRWVDSAWGNGFGYMVSIEDPFDSSENCARSLGARHTKKLLRIAGLFSESVEALACLYSAAGKSPCSALTCM